MILDNIKNIGCYSSVGKNIKKFVDYVHEHNVADYEPGEYIIDDDVYFTVKVYKPRTYAAAGWESHKEYIDIQYLLEGKELMGIMDIDCLTIKEEYDKEKDKIAYNPSDEETVLRLRPGMFAILLPQDAHHPTIIDEEITDNKKIVAKIHV